MQEDLHSQVAASLDATPELLPVLPELLADCWELGSDTRTILDLLRPLDLRRDARLLDLGCGKGMAVVSCAREFGWQCTGVDGFEPFIEAAREQAHAAGVGPNCTFCCADLRAAVCTARDYDVVVFSAVGPLIDGRPCVEALRNCVRPGGYMVIDDGFLPDDPGEVPPAYAVYAPYDQTRATLITAGDHIAREVLSSDAERSTADDDATDKIRRRAADIAARRPELAGLVKAYMRRQEQECEWLRRFHVPATWLLKRV